MTPVIIAIFLSLGIAVWVYSKLYGRTGGNNSSSIIASAAVGAVVFFVSWAVFALVV